jgi:hypothetical protein
MVTVPMEIAWKPAWLSWVGSTTTCLEALGVACDRADVAGHSGYAFALSINEGLCPSGPTSLDWAALATGVLNLGRTTVAFVSGDCYTRDRRSDRTRAHARAVLDLVRRETEAGRPCVVWGLGVPEFGVVRGVEGEEYLCVAGGPTPERLRWDGIEAPGGPYALAFPTPMECSWNTDRDAVRRAVMMMSRPDWGPKWTCGDSAYASWIAQLGDRAASRFGGSYNAQCWAEGRAHARDFLERAAGRQADIPALRAAHAALVESAAALREVAALFPFTQEPGKVNDGAAIEAAVGHLRRARDADGHALVALREALAVWPGDRL